MAELTVQAIVLRRRDVGDNDRRLTLLTAELGKLDVIAKGAKKSGSRLAGASEPLTASVFGIVTGRRTAYVVQVQPIDSYRGLRTDFDRLRCGLAHAELVAAICPYEQPVPEIHALTSECLAALESHPRPVVALVWAEMRLMEASGFHPEFDRCVVSGIEVAEAEPWISPHAGGYVRDEDAPRFNDRFKTRAEVLYGLRRLAALESPPPALKFAPECARALLPFWRALAESPLPANETLVRELEPSQPSVN